jgi:hypothetical protein
VAPNIRATVYAIAEPSNWYTIRGQHASRHLAEVEYRFNRRHDLKAMLPRFLTVAARTPPMPYRFLELAEPYA